MNSIYFNTAASTSDRKIFSTTTDCLCLNFWAQVALRLHSEASLLTSVSYLRRIEKVPSNIWRNVQCSLSSYYSWCKELPTKHSSTNYAFNPSIWTHKINRNGWNWASAWSYRLGWITHDNPFEGLLCLMSLNIVNRRGFSSLEHPKNRYMVLCSNPFPLNRSQNLKRWRCPSAPSLWRGESWYTTVTG